MNFKEYGKIYWLINSDDSFRCETDWILKGKCIIQEKIDGANLSVWRKEWETRVWSRKQDVSDGSFRWAVEYVRTHKWIQALLDTLEWEETAHNVRLYWEWLVPHTITNYTPTSYNHFYLFDIEINEERVSLRQVEKIAKEYDICFPKIFAELDNPSVEDVNKFVWQSEIWPIWEWVVIKNEHFVNQWGHKCYAKIVWEKFKEDNAIVFGNHQKGDTEMKLNLKWNTVGRVRKIINKIEQQTDRDICKKDIKQIIGRTQNDIITEEAWAISKEGTVNFKRLKGLMWKRTALIAIDIIDGNIPSIATEDNVSLS